MLFIKSLLKRYIMKKIFTLLFAVGMFTLSQAQPGTRDGRQNDDRQFDQRDENRYGDEKDIAIDFSFGRDDNFGHGRFSNERKRDQMIARINREYDYKIQTVRNSRFTGRMEKQRHIRLLQEQRQREIRMVYAKFNDRNRFDNRNDRPNRRY
jgi:hypothetical protein